MDPAIDPKDDLTPESQFEVTSGIEASGWNLAPLAFA